MNLEENYAKYSHIIEAGKKLNVKNEVLTTTFVIYHQFEKCVDEANYDPLMVAAASFCLSAKFNEQSLNNIDIINVFYSISNREKPILDKDSIEFAVLSESLLDMELIVGRTLKFCNNYRLSHHYLLYFLKSVIDWQTPTQRKVSSHLTFLCIKFLSDFYLVKRSLLYQPEHVAVAVINMTLESIGMDLDFKDEEFSWHKALCKDLTKSKVEVIVEDITALYE